MAEEEKDILDSKDKNGPKKKKKRKPKTKVRHPCADCGKDFGKRSDLKRHSMVHNGSKPISKSKTKHPCAVCDKEFGKKSDLDRHLMVHNGSKPFKCAYCPHSTNRKGSLVTHMRTHTGERPYKCNLCSYTCRDRSHLRTHLIVHTGERRHRCSGCSFSARLKTQLLKHKCATVPLFSENQPSNAEDGFLEEPETPTQCVYTGHMTSEYRLSAETVPLAPFCGTIARPRERPENAIAVTHQNDARNGEIALLSTNGNQTPTQTPAEPSSAPFKSITVVRPRERPKNAIDDNPCVQPTAVFIQETVSNDNDTHLFGDCAPQEDPFSEISDQSPSSTAETSKKTGEQLYIPIKTSEKTQEQLHSPTLKQNGAWTETESLITDVMSITEHHFNLMDTDAVLCTIEEQMIEKKTGEQLSIPFNSDIGELEAILSTIETETQIGEQLYNHSNHNNAQKPILNTTIEQEIIKKTEAQLLSQLYNAVEAELSDKEDRKTTIKTEEQLYPFVTNGILSEPIVTAFNSKIVNGETKDKTGERLDNNKPSVENQKTTAETREQLKKQIPTIKNHPDIEQPIITSIIRNTVENKTKKKTLEQLSYSADKEKTSAQHKTKEKTIAQHKNKEKTIAQHTIGQNPQPIIAQILSTNHDNLKTTNRKLFQCSECVYSSTKRSDWLQHMRVHTKERPYKCEYCDFSASFKSSIRTHLMRHTGFKGFRCNVCDYSTIYSSALKTHIMRHSGEKRHKCELCSYESGVWSDMRAHLRRHQREGFKSRYKGTKEKTIELLLEGDETEGETGGTAGGSKNTSLDNVLKDNELLETKAKTGRTARGVKKTTEETADSLDYGLELLETKEKTGRTARRAKKTLDKAQDSLDNGLEVVETIELLLDNEMDDGKVETEAKTNRTARRAKKTIDKAQDSIDDGLEDNGLLETKAKTRRRGRPKQLRKETTKEDDEQTANGIIETNGKAKEQIFTCERTNNSTKRKPNNEAEFDYSRETKGSTSGTARKAKRIKLDTEESIDEIRNKTEEQLETIKKETQIIDRGQDQ